MRIEGASALVAGGASGLGEATARRLHEGGAGVVIADLNAAEAEALAADAGLALVASHDLSSLQRLGRPRDRFIHAVLPLLRRVRSRSMWAQSLVGGDALQDCHRNGLLEYRMLRFERRTT